MKFILIDTNIFINLISESREEYFLDELQRLVDGDYIKLCVPTLLLSEWEEKKKMTIERFEKTLNNLNNASGEEIFGESVSKVDFIKKKAAIIDSLLQRGVSIKISRKVDVETILRKDHGVAPFHDDRSKSFNDARIYLSTVSFIRQRRIKGFAFITNDGGFRDPLANSLRLHPQLEFKNIACNYFVSVWKFLIFYKDEFEFKNPSDKTIGESAYIIKVVKDDGKGLLHYLEKVLLACHRKISFMPPEILCRIHPFKIKTAKYNYTYYAGQTLVTNNEDLYFFLKNIDVQKTRFKKQAGISNSKK